MADEDAANMAFPGGLAFKKLDLHLHTPASSCFRDKTVNPEAIVQSAIATGLDGIAVTDHNTAAWVDRVKEAATGTALAVFPGVEITCTGGKDGIHIIALFDVDKDAAYITALLNKLDIKPDAYGKQEAMAPTVPQKVIEAIHLHEGVASLAHANSAKGVLGDMQGEQRTKVIQCPFLFAAEGTDFDDDAKKEKRRRVVDLLDGTDPTYERKLAVYQASDNPCADGTGGHGLEGIGTRCAYFKLETVNLAGLKQCFFDPDVRIRQDFQELPDLAYPFIKEVRITGGYLDGSTFPFHSGLNSLLGAKGTGKSLLIELMRFALDQESINKEIAEDHESKLQVRFGTHSTVELTVVDSTGKEVSLHRKYAPLDDSPYEDDGHEFAAAEFPVLFLSQNEIIRIAESEDQQIAFIDSFFDFRSYKVRLEEVEHELQTNDRQMADSIRAREEAVPVERRLAHIATELTSLNKELKRPEFEKYAKAEAKNNALIEFYDYVNDISERIDDAKAQLTALTVPDVPEEWKDDPSLKRCEDVANDVRTIVDKHLDALGKELGGLKERVVAERIGWKPAFEKVQTKYQDTVKTVGGDYRQLALKRDALIRTERGLRKKLAIGAESRGALTDRVDARHKLLDRIETVYREYTQARQGRCAAIQQESSGRLQVSIQGSSNAETFHDTLLKLRKGSGFREADLERVTSTISPRAFVFVLFRHQLGSSDKLEQLAESTGVDPGKLKGFADYLTTNVTYEELLALQYRAIPQDRPAILYNLGDDRWEPLSRISTGQKAVAMLIMALSGGSMPIVIDQPEDSLDLRSVWDDICTKIRRGKDSRQFIFTTHNSSLAVASDTDCFIVLAGDANHGYVVGAGSMDHPPIDDLVLSYLEGGPETYAMKYRKYDGAKKISNR